MWMCTVDYAVPELCKEISICCLVHSSDWRERLSKHQSPANQRPHKPKAAAHRAKSAGKIYERFGSLSLSFFFLMFTL